MNSIVAWRGPSLLNGEPIAVVLTGLRQSYNEKTGAMVQAYILADNMSPLDAVRSGKDSSVCGNCPHRGRGVYGRGRTCYVQMHQGVAKLGRKFAESLLPQSSPEEAAGLLYDRMVRLGAYGDPAAVPRWVWYVLIREAKGWTGYTHQWRRFPELKHLLMASVEDPVEAHWAQMEGWRTFRMRRVFDGEGIEPLRADEISCPASSEAGRKVTCEDCRLCCGLERSAAKNIAIVDHSTQGRFRKRRLQVLL